jgi:hypothetical protein
VPPVIGRRFERAIALGAATAMLCSGCGGGSSKKSTTAGGGGSAPAPSTPKTTTPAVYIQAVCGAVSTWLQSIKSSQTQLSANPPTNATQGKQVLQGFIAGMVTDTDRALAMLQAAGAPNTTNGPRIEIALVGVFTQVKTVLLQAQTQVSQLPTANPAAFKAAATQLGVSVKQSLTNVASSLSVLNDPQLNQAAAQTPACQSLKA